MANEYNTSKLEKELRQAGIPIEGCNSNGAIWFKPEATPAQQQLASDILKNHDPTPEQEPVKIDLEAVLFNELIPALKSGNPAALDALLAKYGKSG